MPACRWPSSTVTTRRPFARTLLWTGSFKRISFWVARPHRGPQPSSGPRDLRRRRGREGSASLGSARQAQGEGRPLPGDRARRELPGMLLGDLLREREAEAGAAFLGGEERIEDPTEPLGRDPRTGVAELDEDVAVGEARPDEDGAAPRHGLPRVADEIQEQLADLSHVGEHLGKVPGEALLEGDAGGGQLGADEVEEVAHRLVELGTHELRLGKARVAQVLLGDDGEAVDLAHDRVAERGRARLLRSAQP